MAFLDILNIPGLLGTELHTFKRANVYDKLDLGLAGVVALLAGVVLLLNGLVTNKTLLHQMPVFGFGCMFWSI